MPRGKGERCVGFWSSEPGYVHCTREEYANGLTVNERTSPPTYAHHIKGGCKCGVFHDLGEVVATYNYNLNGTTYYQVVRYRPKNFRPRTPLPKGGWLNKYPANGKRVLYNLDGIHGAAKDEWVLYCEGEKDVETCRKRGLTATTHAGGANGWRSELTSELKGRKVALFPHNDEDSRRMAKRIVSDLSGVAREVKAVTLPDLPEHGDITDWFEKGGTVDELRDLINGAKSIKSIKKKSVTKNLPPSAKGFHRTDTGNAERLAARHSDALRWCKELGWLYWDGRRWVADDIEADRRAKETVRAIYAEAAACTDDDERKVLGAWAAASESALRIKAMLDRARSEKAITVQINQLDADSMLLNVRNGTIELKAGKLREHRPGDLITKLAPVDYDPRAHSTLWERFLKEATAGQDGMSDFLRRGVGYTLTGDTREDRLFLEHGPAGAGKSTFINAVRNTFGDYAGSVRIEALTDRAGSSGHNEDIAVLAGKRMVLAVEASESDRLREGLVKTLTGGDQVPASKKYKSVFFFVPQFKLWLATNHVPRIRSDDSGMWRRLLKLPFLNVPAEPDKKLRRALESDGVHRQAILAWAVKGCLEWQRGGLQPPECVQFATDQLRKSMDSLDEFFEDCCEFEKRAFATVKEIRWAYIRWASDQGISERFYVSPNRMAESLQERDCESAIRRIAGQQVRGYWGMRIREGAHAHGVKVVKK